ncbi:MAG: LysM domain-containing protein [Chloroflexota bacterium]
MNVRTEGGSSWIADLEFRSPDPAVCPFLRSEGPDGRLARPIERPDAANRCDAFGEPRPQSNRQQELACLTDAHGECARYLRGSLVAADRIPPGHQRRGLTTPILAAVLLLAATSAASLAFIAARGGLDLPVAPPATTAAILGGSTRPTLEPASPEPTIDVTPAASPDLEPTPVPAATTTPTPTPTPTPRSDRYALLEPCPDKPDCWIYTVRTGDNLSSIANYFGIPLETVYALNPELRTESLQAGRLLVLPPPTR